MIYFSMKFYICSIFVFSIVLACSDKGTEPEITEDTYIEKDSEISVNGIDLNYTIAVPYFYNAEKNPIPLILALHWGGYGDPAIGKGFLNSFVFTALKGLKAIMVAPTCPVQNGWDNPTSEAVVMALLDTLQQEYNIDTGKILVTGYSMGAIGTWYFAGRHADHFTAAIPIAGIPDANTISQLKDVPFYVIHGTDDELFPFQDMKQIYLELNAAGQDIEFKAVQDASHYNTDAYFIAYRESTQWVREKWNISP